MMIFANNGYQILSQFLNVQKFEENKFLIFMAIDVFSLHFDQSISSQLLPHADIAKIFSRENVAVKLAKILNKLLESL